MRRKADRIGLEFVGFTSVTGDADKQIESEKVLNIREPLESFVTNQCIDEIVIAIDERRNNLPIEELLRLKKMGVQITYIVEFFERETGQVAVDFLNPS